MSNRTTRGILERLKSGGVQGAEGYVFELERRGYIKAGPYVPEVVLDFPEAVKELHREFLRAGSEVMVALTYYAHREKLKDVGRENDLELMNRQAVRLANEVAREGDALVAGNICNTWAYDPQNPKASSRILASVQHDQTQDGYDYVEACKILADHGADIVGLNCDRGPETMLPIIENIRSVVSCYVAAQPVPYKTNAQYPTFESLRTASGERAFPLLLEPFLYNRFEMAEFARRARAIGVNYIGICCGGAPHYVRAMAEALGRTVPASKYSPVMELHPVLGSHIEEKHKEFLADWKG